jgi:hypothetical protein
VTGPDIADALSHAGIVLAPYQIRFLQMGGGAIVGEAKGETPAPIPLPTGQVFRFERRNCGGPVDWLLVRLT